MCSVLGDDTPTFSFFGAAGREAGGFLNCAGYVGAATPGSVPYTTGESTTPASKASFRAYSRCLRTICFEAGTAASGRVLSGAWLSVGRAGALALSTARSGALSLDKAACSGALPLSSGKTVCPDAWD